MGPARFRSIDLLISCSRKEIAGFQREPFFTDTEVTVVRKGHPSASRMKNLKTFLNSEHVAVIGRALDTRLRQQGLNRQIGVRVPSYLQAIQAVAQSDLVAFVPKRLAQSLAAPLSLRLLPPPIDAGKYREFLFYPRRSAQDAASLWLRKMTL